MKHLHLENTSDLIRALLVLQEDASEERLRQEKMSNRLNRRKMNEKDEEEKSDDAGDEKAGEDDDDKADDKKDDVKKPAKKDPGMLPGADRLEDDVLPQGETPTSEDIAQRVNFIRAGASLKDEKVKKNIAIWISQLRDPERLAAYTALDALAQIILGGKSPAEAPTFTDPAGLTIKGGAVGGESSVSKSSTGSSQNSKGPVPITVGESVRRANAQRRPAQRQKVLGFSLIESYILEIDSQLNEAERRINRRQSRKAESLNEGLSVPLVLGGLLSIPTLIKWFGKVVSSIIKIYAKGVKAFGAKSHAESAEAKAASAEKLANSLYKKGHHLIQDVFKKFVKGFLIACAAAGGKESAKKMSEYLKTEEGMKRLKIAAECLELGVTAVLGYFSAAGTYSAMKQAHTAMAGTEAVLTLVKGSHIGEATASALSFASKTIAKMIAESAITAALLNKVRGTAVENWPLVKKVISKFADEVKDEFESITGEHSENKTQKESYSRSVKEGVAKRLKEVDVPVRSGKLVPYGSKSHIEDLRARIEDLTRIRSYQEKGSDSRHTFGLAINSLKQQLRSAMKSVAVDNPRVQPVPPLTEKEK